DDRRAELDECALVMIETFARGDGTETLAAWRSLADNEEKMHVWAALGAESKLRAFIKANK
ncbi:MAG: hypothetical protein RJB26_673, partial [Pseudomonadota bacterium]